MIQLIILEFGLRISSLVFEVWGLEFKHHGVPGEKMQRLQVDGKFFRAGGRRVFLKMVTYGPFADPRPGALGDDGAELKKMAEAGFNAVRVYDMPTAALLDAARNAGLWVFAGLEWQWSVDFVSKPGLISAAGLKLKEGLDARGDHEALAGVFVANEVPADLVRWMGVTRVRAVLEDLIALGRNLKPELLFAYSNFPTTEYLEPENADFTAMNVYLEEQEKFASYLPRLHNVAGDRPVLISEVGFDSMRGGEDKQAEILQWSVRESILAGMAGVTIYAWSDWWLSAGKVVDDWSFGLTDRDGLSKPSLTAVSKNLLGINLPEDGLAEREWPMFSVVICTYNGAHRMDDCLRTACRMDYPRYEVIVVDDGSTDALGDVVRKYPEVRLIHVEHGGLSAARNRGAEVARGEFIAYTDDDCQPDTAWLFWLADAFESNQWDACGGPNLPPLPRDRHDIDEAVVAAAPGAPSHVLLTDQEAEHLPGCNLVVRKTAFEKIEGFRVGYRVAGDDVDFCWRLHDSGCRLGFCGAAFVWHRRRTTLWRYFKQQFGYGKAEALLMRDHPERFVRGGGARWQGRVYAGGSLSADRGDTIYHGSMGTAGYQQVSTVMQPQRPLPVGFDGAVAKTKLALAQQVQPLVRRWARWWFSRKWRAQLPKEKPAKEFMLVDRLERTNDYEARWWSDGFTVTRLNVLDSIQQSGWEALDDDSDWDMERDEHRLLIASEQHTEGMMILSRIEMGERSEGRLPADLVAVFEELGLMRKLG